jgi:heptosyltransferase-2
MPYRNILVRATNWVGDAVMSLPALQHLRLHFPDARISILARPWVAALYARESFCNELISYEGSPWQRMATATRLRSRHFDCALLLQNAFEAAAVACLARVPVRIGYDRDARGWLLTRPVPAPRPGEIPKHQRFYYLELLKRAGLIPSYDSQAPIVLAGADKLSAAGRQRLRKLVWAESAIGVNPGAAYGGAKRWLPERFAESAINIAANLQSAVIVMGSKSEYEICEQVRSLTSAAGIESVNLAGKTTLDAFIEVSAACRLILTNDSGAMHIGSALGVPTVTIFGATDDQATGPTGPLARVVRQPVECSPCLLRECPIDHRCMTRVDSGRVVQTALELLHGE